MKPDEIKKAICENPIVDDSEPAVLFETRSVNPNVACEMRATITRGKSKLVGPWFGGANMELAKARAEKWVTSQGPQQ